MEPKNHPGVLSLQNIYIIGTCFVLAAAFSPPGCPCQHNIAYKCPPLRKTNCEVVYDFCGCCPQCALAVGEICQEFGTLCQKGLICLWDRFWYDEPLSGKCWYKARQTGFNSVGNKLNLSDHVKTAAATVAVATTTTAATTTTSPEAHSSSISVDPSGTTPNIMANNLSSLFETTNATTFPKKLRKKQATNYQTPSKWSYILGLN